MAYFLAVRAFLKHIPWQVWCGIAVVALLWWTYNTGYNNARDKGRAEMSEMVGRFSDAQAQAERIALAAKAEQERRYADLAQRIDDDHASNQAAASTATDRYIARNRVQPCPVASATSGAVAAPDDHSAGVPTPVPPGVVMGDADVRACAALYAYGAAAHEWGRGLGN